jgi:hypothetical protein
MRDELHELHELPNAGCAFEASERLLLGRPVVLPAVVELHELHELPYAAGEFVIVY